MKITRTLLAGAGFLFTLVAQPVPPVAPVPPAPPASPRFVWTSGGSFLGVGVAEITSERARALNLKDEYGVEVTRVDDNSPAAKAGVQRGDAILEYNGQRVEGIEQLQRMIRETPAGRSVKLLISRGGSPQTLSATLQSQRTHAKEIWGPESIEIPEIRIPEIHIPDVPGILATTHSARLGIEAESLGPQLAEYFGVKEGVLVRSVNKGSAAEKAGMKAGDVIVRVDKTKVTTAGEISGAIRAARSSGTFPVDLKRDRKDVTVTVSIEQASNENRHVRVVREPPI